MYNSISFYTILATEIQYYIMYIYVCSGIWAVLKCANALPQNPLSPLPPVVPIIPVVIPLAIDLSDAVSRELVVRMPTGENNGQGL